MTDAEAEVLERELHQLIEIHTVDGPEEDLLTSFRRKLLAAEPPKTELVLSDVLTPLRDYLGHGSFRCERSNHNRWPSNDWDRGGDCYCGLVAALIEAGCSKPEALHIAKEMA